MSHALEGITRFIDATVTSTGAGDTDVDLRPAAGCIWEVIGAIGTQDDGAVATKWLSTDPDNTDMDIYNSETAAAAWAQLPFVYWRSAIANAAPVVLTRDRYMTFRFTASAAAKHAWIRAIVKEYKGVATEA